MCCQLNWKKNQCTFVTTHKCRWFDTLQNFVHSIGTTTFEMMLLSRNSTLERPKSHLAINKFSPACMLLMKTDSMLSTSSLTVLAAMPMLSTYWAQLLALTRGSRNSRIMLLKTDIDPFEHWANLR